jgi:transposase
MRREVLELVERARAAGEGCREIAKQLGVSFHTLMGWRQRAKKGSAVQRVRVAPARVARAAVVRGPRGLEIEGLTMSELAELWLRLG